MEDVLNSRLLLTITFLYVYSANSADIKAHIRSGKDELGLELFQVDSARAFNPPTYQGPSGKQYLLRWI